MCSLKKTVYTFNQHEFAFNQLFGLCWNIYLLFTTETLDNFYTKTINNIKLFSQIEHSLMETTTFREHFSY